jgi:hypothetical protein
MKSKLFFLALVLVLSLPSLPAAEVFPVQASATFTGGIYGTWDITFESGPVGLFLQQITIDLSPTGTLFDTAPGGFGYSEYRDVGGYNGTDVATGMYQILPGTGIALDGGQVLTFLFDDFTVGETFHFTADVDNNPTLRSCTGLGPILRALCQAANDVAITAAPFVTANQFQGAQVTYTFGSPTFFTKDFTEPFSPDGGLRVFGSTNGVFDEIEAVPEPGTFLSLGAGLVLLGVTRLRGKRR